MEKPRKVLGVLGGLGPMASAYFYELLCTRTHAGRDQDHIDLILSSKATTPDRTAFILGQSGADPFGVMEAEALHLVASGAEVLAMPCNTAHYFYQRLANAVPVPVLHMIEDTVARAGAMGAAKVGILATDGTIATDTYQRVCRRQGLACAVPNEAGQAAVMRVIYEDIKRGAPPNMEAFGEAAQRLFNEGCDLLLLACTELSLLNKAGLLDTRYLDSMDVLAFEAILACGAQPQGFPWQ